MSKFACFKKIAPGRRPALICLLAGALSAAAFPPFNLWPVVLLGLLPLWYFAHRLTPAQAFGAGWLWGLGLYLCSMYWLVYVMVNYGGLPLPLAVLVFLLLCLYLGLYVAVMLWLLARLRTTWVPAWLSAPLLWAGLEFLRGIALTGFPWLPLSLCLTSYPSLLQSAEFWGSVGLSAMLVLLSMLIAHAAGFIKPLLPPRRLHYAFLVVAVLFLGWVWGSQLKVERMQGQMAQAPQALVSVVQANIPLNQLWLSSMRSHNIMEQLTLSQQAAGQATTRPWLLLWSESAAPFVFLQDVNNTMPVLREAASLRAWLALGSTGVAEYEGELHYTNRMYLVSPQGEPVDFYDKVHLVPFGEYVPLSKLLFFVRAIAALSMDMAPGQAGKTLVADEVTMGPLICYESIFSVLAREHKQAGANLLVNPTNDSWFGPTAASQQHLAHLVLRAVENRISCARPANTGISCFILPTGQVIEKTEIFTQDTRTANLPLWSQTTIFSKYGEVIGVLGLLFCMGSWLWVIIVPRIKKIRLMKNDRRD